MESDDLVIVGVDMASDRDRAIFMQATVRDGVIISVKEVDQLQNAPVEIPALPEFKISARPPLPDDIQILRDVDNDRGPRRKRGKGNKYHK